MGNVWGFAHRNAVNWRKIKVNYKIDRYPFVRIVYLGKVKRFNLGRLVLKTFSPTTDKTLQADHINNDKKDNRLCNLQWLSQKDNLLKKYREDGNKTHFAKPVAQMDSNGNLIQTFPSALDAQKSIGVPHSSISRACRSFVKLAGGYKWKHI